MTMKEFATLPIDRLVNDVAVDPVHVRELADSIKVSGPISPVMVRQESYELIDGFHRVAAMQELGFTNVECIVTPCDDEAFWDLRIMSASLHKSVAFARAADWVEECFKVSPWASKYKSAYSLFAGSRINNLPPEANSWVAEKSQKWGLTPRAVEEWLYTKQSLAPEVLQEATRSDVGRNDLGYTHLREIARAVPNRPDLQKQVAAKARAESLSSKETAHVARAVKQAPSPEIVSGILIQPVSRTSDDLTRAATVERILSEPKREPAPREKRRELTGVALDVFLSLQQHVHNIDYNLGRLNGVIIANLTPNQQDEMLGMIVELKEKLSELDGKLGQLQDDLGKPAEVSGRVLEGQVVSVR